MDCSQARLQIGPDLGPQNPSEDNDAAFAHYENCGACQSFYQIQSALSLRLRAASTAKASNALRDAVLARAVTEATPGVSSLSRPKRPWRIVGSLLAAAATVAIWFGVTQPASDSITPAFATAVQASQPQNVLESSEPASLLAWFVEAEVPAFEIPDIADAVLQRGRIIEIEGQRAAAIDFDRGGVELTYVMAPVDQWLAALRRDGIRSGSSLGVQIAAWEEAGTARAVLASIPTAELLEVAEACKNKRAG